MIVNYENYLKYAKFEVLESWEKLFCITSPTHGSQFERRDYGGGSSFFIFSDFKFFFVSCEVEKQILCVFLCYFYYFSWFNWITKKNQSSSEIRENIICKDAIYERKSSNPADYWILKFRKLGAERCYQNFQYKLQYLRRSSQWSKVKAIKFSEKFSHFLTFIYQKFCVLEFATTSI